MHYNISPSKNSGDRGDCFIYIVYAHEKPPSGGFCILAIFPLIFNFPRQLEVPVINV